jgi:hypothetical protein
MDTMRRALAGIPLALLLVGCGSETANTATDAADEPKESPSASPSYAPPKGLTGPTGERVSTEGGSFAEWPDGAEDPEQLIAEQSTEEGDWVLVGKRAYVLRPDGTAFEVHNVVKGPKGWILHGYEACAE